MKPFFVVAIVVLCACETDVNVGTKDGGGPTGACTIENCSGCCDANDVCQLGTSVSVCGVTGHACIQCGTGLTCAASGQGGVCRPPDAGSVVSRCNPSNCSGCCDAATGQCQTGTANERCGESGATCASCASGVSCRSTSFGGTCGGALDAGMCVDVFDCPRVAGQLNLGCEGSHCTYASGLGVFITATPYPGDLGGLAGADAKCQLAATAANRTGHWKAFISSSTENAVTRMAGNGPWFQARAPAQRVFNNTANLQTVPLVALGFDETDVSFANSGPIMFWTGTAIGGATSSQTCNGFTTASASVNGTVGHTNSTDATWVALGPQSCSNSQHLLCFEQP